MRRVMAVLLWIGCAATPTAAAETTQAASRIVSVTVFPDRAAVTRQASLTLSKGPSTVEIGPLPSEVEQDSVSAKGVGGAEVTLYGVRLVTRQLETAQDPKAKTLEASIRELTRNQQRVQRVTQVLEQERAYLASIHAASGEQLGKDLVTKSPSATDAAALLKFLDDAFLNTVEREGKADEELEQLSVQLDKLRRELAELSQGRQKQQTLILVDLEARKGGPFELEVSYRVPGALWLPQYEARASTASTEVEVLSYGLVRQRTGEDWDGVALTLSTAKPAVSGTMPEIHPWFLRPWESLPQQRGGSNAFAPTLSLAQKALDERESGGGLPAELASAIVQAQGPVVTFRLPRPESIPADWQPHKAPIGAAKFQGDIAYETTPRLIPSAFLRAKVTNTTETLFLAGTVSVFLDGAFVGSSALKQIAPSETFDLSLGVDERVKIERKPLKERVEISLLPGLRGKTKTTDYEFLTTVENWTGRPIRVTAVDQVPVSEREEVVVDSIKQMPPTVEPDKEKPGVFRWALALGPGQRQELRLSYRIRHPVDMQLQ